MIKSKLRSAKTLDLHSELAAAERLNSVKVVSTATVKRRRYSAETARQHHKAGLSAPRPQPCTRTLRSSSAPSSPSPAEPLAPKSETLKVPRITIRAPTPEPEPALDHLFAFKAVDGSASNKDAPLYSKLLLEGLCADLSNAEEGVDCILSKYLDVRKNARSVCIELLRFLTSSICRLQSFVKDPESEFGLAKSRAISSQLFRHTVTGFLHLLDDSLSPFGTASNLALVSAKIVQDFDKATEYCNRLLNLSSCIHRKLNHGKLFLNVLREELDKILERGLAMTDMYNRLNLPGKGSSVFPCFSVDAIPDTEGTTRISHAGGSAWKECVEHRKRLAREGDLRDRFVSIDVVRYIGELAIHEVVGVPVLTKWLDRFLTHTVYLGIPSAWEIECACALLITVGAMLDCRPEPGDPSTTATASPAEEANTGLKASSSRSRCQNSEAVSSCKTESRLGFQLLQKAMDKVECLITEAQISGSAREWLVEVQQLRNRNWSRESDHDSSYEKLDSD